MVLSLLRLAPVLKLFFLQALTPFCLGHAHLCVSTRFLLLCVCVCAPPLHAADTRIEINIMQTRRIVKRKAQKSPRFRQFSEGF